jgi:hypothetical protein
MTLTRNEEGTRSRVERSRRHVAQGTAHGNVIVNVYEDRLEILSGWQGQKREEIGLREVSTVEIRGWVNCTLTVQTNAGRVYRLERMQLPDARQVKKAVEEQKRRAGLYE